MELSDCRWCQDLYKGFLMTHTCIIMSALLPAKRPWDEGTVSHNKHQKNINNIFKNIRAKVLVKHRTKRISVFILCIALKGRSASEQEGRMNKYLGDTLSSQLTQGQAHRPGFWASECSLEIFENYNWEKKLHCVENRNAQCKSLRCAFSVFFLWSLQCLGGIKVWIISVPSHTLLS